MGLILEARSSILGSEWRAKAASSVLVEAALAVSKQPDSIYLSEVMRSGDDEKQNRVKH